VLDGVTGTVVAYSRSDDALADAIRALVVDDEQRISYGRRGREVAVQRFEWDRLAAQLSSDLAPFDHFGANFQLS
jgi:glycosyltransferase involved in cell wall biosynthesis